VCRGSDNGHFWHFYQQNQWPTERCGKKMTHCPEKEICDASRTLECQVVYFIRIGKWIKVGITGNLDRRLKEFATSTAEPIQVLATFPGGRLEERRLHEALAASRRHGEFFESDMRLSGFIERIAAGENDAAWQWLEWTDPRRIEKLKAGEFQRKVVERRRTKKEEDAYYGGLVAERKQRLGW
jgi:Meiotically up-regulated gene 113